MAYQHWSSLFRAYDLSLGRNRWVLALAAAGAATGYFLGEGTFAARALQGVAGGGMVFGAGALAKELVPDRGEAAVPAALLALPFAAGAPLAGLVALFWLLGGMRFLNRTTGLRPRATDTLVLLVAAALLAWRVSPLFGLLAGIMAALDALLPDGRRGHLALGIATLVAAGWLLLDGEQSPVPLSPAYTAIALTIAVGFILIILNSFQIAAVGDATSEPLSPLRVQAGQAFALSAGLFSASWLGQGGILLLIGLWAALAGVLAHKLATFRSRRSIPSL